MRSIHITKDIQRQYLICSANDREVKHSWYFQDWKHAVKWIRPESDQNQTMYQQSMSITEAASASVLIC